MPGGSTTRIKSLCDLARNPRRSLFQTPRRFEEIRSPLFVHSPLTTAIAKSERSLWQQDSRCLYPEEVHFLLVVAEQIGLAFDNALLL